MGVAAETDRASTEAAGFCAATEGVVTGAGLAVAYLVPLVRTDGSATATGLIVVAARCVRSYVRVVGLVTAGLGPAMGFVVVRGGRARGQIVYSFV